MQKWHIWGCIQKFPDCLPGARTANGTALCQYVQLYHYFVSQSNNKFCHSNPLCYFSVSVYCCCLFHYRVSLETFGYTLVDTVAHLRHVFYCYLRKAWLKHFIFNTLNTVFFKFKCAVFEVLHCVRIGFSFPLICVWLSNCLILFLRVTSPKTQALM